jgi:photosystem II stability/assembly factor-like uncharacterized protein
VTADRRLSLLRRPAAGNPGLVAITAHGKRATYELTDYGDVAIGGRGFEFRDTAAGNSYAVLIAPHGRSTCECMGFTAHGRCKHVAAAMKLMERGL